MKILNDRDTETIRDFFPKELMLTRQDGVSLYVKVSMDGEALNAQFVVQKGNKKRYFNFLKDAVSHFNWE